MDCTVFFLCKLWGYEFYHIDKLKVYKNIDHESILEWKASKKYEQNLLITRINGVHIPKFLKRSLLVPWISSFAALALFKRLKKIFHDMRPPAKWGTDLLGRVRKLWFWWGVLLWVNSFSRGGSDNFIIFGGEWKMHNHNMKNYSNTML